MCLWTTLIIKSPADSHWIPVYFNLRHSVHDLPDDCDVEGPSLLRSGDDLLGRQDEPVVAGVSQLHRGGEPDPGLPLRPVNGAAAGHVQQTGDAAGLKYIA